MESTHTYGYLEIKPKKKSVIIGAYVYEFISEVPVPLSMFYLVQRTVRVTDSDRLGGEEWKAGVARRQSHGPWTGRGHIFSCFDFPLPFPSLIYFLLLLSFSVPLTLQHLCFGPVGVPTGGA